MPVIQRLLARPLVLAAVSVLAVGCGTYHVRADLATAADTVTEIHYSFGNTRDSVWFDWHGQERDIYYGLDTAYGLMAQAGSSPTTPVDTAGPFRQVELTALQPGATYHYKIGSNGIDHTFQTIPNGDFTWVDVGDTSTTRCQPWAARTHQLVAAQDPAFVTHGGDISYANGCGIAAVHQYYVDQQVWSAGAAFEPVWGNHEYGQPNADEGMTPPPGTPQDSLLNYKGRSFITNGQAVPNDTGTSTANPGCGWETKATANTCQGNDWGWFQTGHVLFISYPEPWPGADAAWQAAADQLMASAQANPSIDFIVTYGHRPDYSSVESDVDATLRAAIDSLAMKYSPSASNPYGKYVLNVDHHVHWEEVFKPIDGLVNITNGGGGVGQVDPATLDPNSIYHIVHPGILLGNYSAAQHSLTVQLLCGPAFPNPKATCSYGSVLYSRTFTRPSSQPGPARLSTALSGSNFRPQIGADIAYAVRVSNLTSGTVAQGVIASITLPPGENVVSAGGGTVIGQTVSWNLGTLLGHLGPVTMQLVARLERGTAGRRVTATAVLAAPGGLCHTDGSVCTATGAVTIAATSGGQY